MSNERCLLQPMRPLILLPEEHSLHFGSTNHSCMEYPGFGHTLFSAFNNILSCTKIALHPISWLKLALDSRLKNDVVALILPIISLKKPFLPHKALQKLSKSIKKPFYVETFSNIQMISLDEMNNLTIIVAIPWPDMSSKLLPISNGCEYENEKSFVESRENQRKFIDLISLAKSGIEVYLMSNVFEESTGDLLVTLILLTLRGFGKNNGHIFHDWLTSLAVGFYSKCKVTSPEPQLLLWLTSQLGAHFGSLDLARKAELNSKGERWNKLPLAFTDATVGFVGLTNSLSRCIAKTLSKGLSMKVIYHQRHPLPSIEFTYKHELDHLLHQSDIVVFADDTYAYDIPWSLIHDSRRLVSQGRIRGFKFHLADRHFCKFKPSAFLICATNRQAMSYQKVIDAMRKQQLAGAILVLPRDGSADAAVITELRNLPNVLILPPATSTRFVSKRQCVHLTDLIVSLVSNTVHRVYLSKEPSSNASSPELCHNSSNAVTLTTKTGLLSRIVKRFARSDLSSEVKEREFDPDELIKGGIKVNYRRTDIHRLSDCEFATKLYKMNSPGLESKLSLHI